MDEIRPWRCVNGHVMGQVVREGGVRRLLLYRHAVESLAEDGAAVDVMGVVEGYMDVRCDVCGCVRPWMPGEEALERMLKKMGRKQVVGSR